MDVYDRLMGIALMAKNMKKLDPTNFANEPISGFIDALVADLENAANEWCDED